MEKGKNLNQDYAGHTEQQNVVLFEHRGEQVRLTVSEFRDRLYLGIRVWLQDIEGEWFPTKSGFSFPYNLQSTSILFSALVQILSNSEVLDEVYNRAKRIKRDTDYSTEE